MLLIAFKNIIQEKSRLFISLAGVTFAILLMALLMGIYEGAIQQFTRFVKENPAHVFVAKKGISDYFHGASLIPKENVGKLKNEPGVTDAVPMIGQLAVIDHKNRKYDLFISSFQQNSPMGAPWDVTKGTISIDDNEVIISEILANKLAKSLGDKLTFAEQEFTIKGLVPDATSFGNNFVWITHQKAQEMIQLPVVSFIYVTLDNPGSAENFATTVGRRYPDLSVIAKTQFEANNKAELEEVFLPIIGAIVGIAVIVGMAVIGLTIYTATIDKIREYGVLKAIGVSNGQLFLTVAAQSLLVVSTGFALGIGVSMLVAPTLYDNIGIPPIITGPIVTITALISLVMGVVASLFPLRRLLKIDPAEVFKA